MKIALVDLFDWPFPSLSLAYLLGALEGTAHQAVLIDCFPRKPAEEIERHDPDVIGFSVLSAQLRQTLEVCRRIKARHPEKILFLGGKQPWLRPEETIAEPCVDAICIGEGERTLVELLDRLDAGERPDVPDIWYRHEGQVIRNPPRPFEENLDSLPLPSWEAFDLDSYLSGSSSSTKYQGPRRRIPSSRV